MKITPLSRTKIENILNKKTIKPLNPQDVKSKQLFSIGFDARQNLERFAEHMSAEEYIRAKTYLANLELMELAKGAIL
ncbi:hypothetical protein IKR55_01210 [bacterium]|nr:hypothetical protein [bacterium]